MRALGKIKRDTNQRAGGKARVRAGDIKLLVNTESAVSIDSQLT